MSSRPVRQGALLRGGAAALLTTALTLAAHALGGGGLPSGPAAVQLLLVAATVGATAAALPGAGDVRLMASLLAAGQLAGHGILSAAAHHAHPHPGPGWAMVGAHVAAVLVGAALISVGDRLCRALSRVVRRTVVRIAQPVRSAPAAAVADADQPLFSAVVLVSSLSHRGPPVAA